MAIQNYFASSNTPVPVKLSARVADLALVVGVVAIVALMILPMPPLLIDLLVGVNITFGVLLLMNTLYIRGALDFSAFPSILLVSTLFRLALSIATTRMILTTGHAGHIIQTFGKMVVGGNIVVGLVVFLIITASSSSSSPRAPSAWPRWRRASASIRCRASSSRSTAICARG